MGDKHTHQVTGRLGGNLGCWQQYLTGSSTTEHYDDECGGMSGDVSQLLDNACTARSVLWEFHENAEIAAAVDSFFNLCFRSRHLIWSLSVLSVATLTTTIDI
jgi:hypothetical protein